MGARCYILKLCTRWKPSSNCIFNRKAVISNPVLWTRTQHKARFSPPFHQSAPSFSSKQAPQCGRGATADWLRSYFQVHTSFLTTCSDTSFAGRDWAGRRVTDWNNIIINTKWDQTEPKKWNRTKWDIVQRWTKGCDCSMEEHCC